MKPWVAILIALCFGALAIPSHQGTANATTSGVTNLILDTEMVTSVQDVGALALANTFSNQGQAKLVGVVVDTSSLYTVGCVDAVDTYYGNPVPIGITYPTTTDHSASPDFIYPCATTFPTTFAFSQASPPPPALQVYRRTLAAQPDGSVVIVAIGFEGRLSELLNSPPDSYSPLSGHDLIVKKVKTLVVMGGGYPTYPPSGGLAEHNFRQDPASAINVANNWPTKVVYSGYELGKDIGTGQNLCHTAPATSPVLKTYTIYTHNVPCNYYYSWDLTAVYHAVLGSTDPVMSEVGPGSNLIASDGSNAWITSGGNQYYLTAPSHPQVATTLNTLLAYNPPAPPTSPKTGLVLGLLSAPTSVPSTATATDTAPPSETPTRIATALPSSTPTVTGPAVAPTSTVSPSPTASATATSTAQPAAPTGTSVPPSATAAPTNPPVPPTSTLPLPTATSTSGPIPATGSLVGSAALPPSRVNLTNEGTADWAHWGLTGPTSFDHKAGMASQIPALSNLAGGSLGQTTLSTSFSWSDGTPDAAATDVITAVSLSGNGQGFGLTLPADLTSRTVYLYVAVCSGQANLTASLSDGSAAPYADSSLTSSTGTRMAEYSLTYQAASPGQSLHLSFTLLNSSGAGTISLAAVSLS